MLTSPPSPPDDGWDCRYFQPELPPSLSRASLRQRFGPSEGSAPERDTYLLAPGVHANVKIRSTSATVKLKELIRREDDGFELWRTGVDARLPASRQAWDEIARTLSVELDTARLETISDPADALAALRESAEDVRCVDVVKNRTAFPSDSASVEHADVTVALVKLESVAFESSDLAAARSLRWHLGEEGLGVPESYVDLCRRILGGSV